MSVIHNSGRSFYTGLIEALLSVMGSSKGYLLDHGPRTAHLARQLAVAKGCESGQVARIMLAGILCDVGMIGLAEDAWENPVPVLDPRTRGLVRAHPIRSEATLRGIPHFQPVAKLARSHHEWWNGAGYPDEFAGDEIPLGARILRLADTVTALGEARPQRPPRAMEEIRAVIRDGSGREFDPEIAELWLELDAGGRLTEFSESVYELWSWEASDALVPEEVSPMSVAHLLDVLGYIIDAKDPYTAGHSKRVAAIALEIARSLDLPDETVLSIWAAGFLHDLGKLSIPLRVLLKPGGLTDLELALVKQHTTRGADVLGGIPTLKHLTTGARYHHERWDGGGYPEGLTGDRIPLVPRVLAVADTYDAMTSGRAYRRGCPHERAFDEIVGNRGRQFCPSVTDAFAELPRAFFESVRYEGVRIGGDRREWPQHAREVDLEGVDPGAGSHADPD